MGEHRVTMLGASLRRHGDPARSGDPRVRELVGALATLDPTPPPSAQFRAELRAQLVAVAPRLVLEGERSAAGAPVGQRSAARAAGLRTGNRVALRRPLTIVSGVLTVFAVLLGGAVWMSQRAVPGDTLYGLKRASESVQLSLTSGSAAKGKRYLELATTRSEEVSDLLAHASAAGPGLSAAGLSAQTASLVRSTLGSADSDVRTGTALLTNQAVREQSTHPLTTLTAWAPGQFARMQSIVAALPAGPLKTRAQASSALVLSALNRAAALTKLSGCSCLRTAPTDSLGPVPCSVCSSPAPATNTQAPGSSTAPASSSSTNPTGGTGHTATQGSSGTGSSGQGSSHGSGSPGQTSSTNPLGTLPSLGSSNVGTGVGTGSVPTTLPTSPLPTLASSPPPLTLSLPPLLSSASPTGAPGTSSTCALRIVIPGVLAINTCTGLYVSLG